MNSSSSEMGTTCITYKADEKQQFGRKDIAWEISVYGR
jgi:hypothetical protein